MKFTRIFTQNGQSYFEDLSISLSKGAIGEISSPIEVTQLIFGKVEGIDEISWHNPPCSQYIIMLSGVMKIEVGSGQKRWFYPGDILLAEDITGQGHITRVLNKEPGKYMAIPRLNAYSLAHD